MLSCAHRSTPNQETQHLTIAEYLRTRGHFYMASGQGNRLVEDQLARRVAERVIGFLDPDLGMFRAIIHNHVNQDSTAGSGAGAGAVYFGSVDSSPLSCWPPIPIELVERVIRVLAGMLRPVGIVHPDAVGGFEVL